MCHKGDAFGQVPVDLTPLDPTLLTTTTHYASKQFADKIVQTKKINVVSEVRFGNAANILNGPIRNQPRRALDNATQLSCL